GAFKQQLASQKFGHTFPQKGANCSAFFSLQVFDSTHGRGKPLRLRLGAGKAVKGLEEGILGLQKGGRRLLVVPPCLGYGSQGIPNLVPANSTLIFETSIGLESTSISILHFIHLLDAFIQSILW
uniref:peptidylprolyl isomerase n=1 Tax=Paramormyrops kingsleyae TaxID=1676925 RepID=A0A3B3QYW1_9TELE